jgi:hypothetical protein
MAAVSLVLLMVVSSFIGAAVLGILVDAIIKAFRKEK